MKSINNIDEKPILLNTIVGLIDKARHQVAKTVNQELTVLYWQIGKNINDDILKNKDKADYGSHTIKNLSTELTQKYGTGFNKRNLHSFVKLSIVFQDFTIVHTVCAQLTWSHLRAIIYIDDYNCPKKNYC